MKNKIAKWNKQSMIEIAPNVHSYSELMRQLGVKPVSGNFSTVKKKIKEYNINISHFTGRVWNKNQRSKKKYILSEILVQNSPYNTPSKIRQRLIDEGVKEHKCERCGLTEWLKEPIKLELHHINGVNTDNRIENLSILCPNCHAFTDNYRGKNVKRSALSERREVEYRKFREALASNVDGNPEPSLNKEGAETLHDKPKFVNIDYCKTCQKSFAVNSKNKTFCSVDCYRRYNHSTVPTPGEIFEAFDKHKNFLQVGRYFGVSDNAVRKWCNSYGITSMVKRKSRPQILN